MEQLFKLNSDAMRQNNLRLILEEIYCNSGITKANLAEKTGMSAMAAGRIADYLIERGWVCEADQRETARKGRPGKGLRINCEKLCHVGISLDANGIFVGYIDPYGTILHRAHHIFPQGAHAPEQALRALVQVLRNFITQHAIDTDNAVGLVLPGLIDCECGVVKLSSQLHWENYPLVEALSRELDGLPIVLDNDIKARAQAESRLDPLHAYANSVLLNIGSGIGAGIIINGKIYRGNDNMAGEIGHIVINANGRLCECGRTGCLQANLTEVAILREAQAIQPNCTLEDLFAAYRREEPWAKNLLSMVSSYINMTINLLANTYAPQAIVLCGSLIDKSVLVRQLITTAFARQHKDLLNNHFELRFSDFGPDGNILGASTVAFHHTLNSLE